jgi:hypothetical protein
MERDMKKIDLILTAVILMLLAAAFAPGLVIPVQASGAGQTILLENDAARMAPAVSPINPATQLVAGLVGLLFGGFSVLPLLGNAERDHEMERSR